MQQFTLSNIIVDDIQLLDKTLLQTCSNSRNEIDKIENNYSTTLLIIS